MEDVNLKDRRGYGIHESEFGLGYVYDPQNVAGLRSRWPSSGMLQSVDSSKMIDFLETHGAISQKTANFCRENLKSHWRKLVSNGKLMVSKLIDVITILSLIRGAFSK